ncbi:MAG: L-threonylcarbamoyladenylate synthase [Verrucomicrobiales bacterium]
MNDRTSTEVLATDEPRTLGDAARRASERLLAGDVVALPTETVYGLAANALDAEAVAKVFAVKERPAFDPLIVHVRNLDAVREIADVPSEIEDTVIKLANAFWPGPLTLLLPKKPVVPDLVTSGLPTVAMRVPAHPVFRRVLKECRVPLAAPSANRFGRISPTTAAAVEKELGGRIPLILDGGACAEGLESTILRITRPAGTPKPVLEVVRSGPITREMLKAFGVVKKASSDASPDAPGQLASHYAPATPVRLLEPGETFEPQSGRRYGLLSLDGQPRNLNLDDFSAVAVLSPGSGKLSEAAIRLFAMLRQLDEAGVDEIIAEPVAGHGLGTAIMDRLRRAAGRG